MVPPARCEHVRARGEEVGRWLERPVALATEEEASALSPDCEHGAIPPIAAAYGLTAIIDASLEGHEHVYFEGGDHRALVHVTGAQFHRSRTPGFDACRAHLALGISGKLEMWRSGKEWPDMQLDNERGARHPQYETRQRLAPILSVADDVELSRARSQRKKSV